MVPVKKPGRPLTTCPHLPGTMCDCRFQTIASISSSEAASNPNDLDSPNTTIRDHAATIPAMTTTPHWASVQQSAGHSTQTYHPTSPATDPQPFLADQPVFWTGSESLVHNSSFPEDMFLASARMTGQDLFPNQYPSDVASRNEYTIPEPQGYWWLAPEGPSSYPAGMELATGQEHTFPQRWNDPSLDEDGGADAAATSAREANRQ